tara:strand:- start:107 stop:520 length:414 start_codon:yes stop_codon:yes gene_type:complete
MKKIFIIILSLFLFSCSTVNTNYQADTSVVVQVDSDNYEIVGDIEGEATGNIIWFGWVPFMFGNNNEYGRVQNSLSKGYVYDMAMYNAIEDANIKYPGGVDAIITPKYTSSTSGFPPFWWKLNVKIKGKGIRFTTSS